jgi:4'-phosphopantetheinyl transferase
MSLEAPLVWLADGRAVDDAALKRISGWLGESERRRYAAFTRPLRRRQFLIGRILLRRALGELLGVSPDTVMLTERHGAAPLLESPCSPGTGFSISHSGQWVACAAGKQGPLGLDIEVLDPARDVAALAGQAFDADELAWWQARPHGTRRRDFYELWCAKEARSKRQGGEGECIKLAHEELAIVLCGAPLSPPPVLALLSHCQLTEL